MTIYLKATLLLIVFILFPILSKTVHARIGVGVGTGKIVVDENLKPGSIYTLPDITVINTGDVPADYGIRVAYHHNQKEKLPQEEWFSFNPSTFYLEPGKAQTVKIDVSIPIKVEPGDYFAYIEGYPAVTSNDGSTNISIAAATKIYFKVDPANIFEAIYYKVTGLFNKYQPYSTIVVGLIGLALLVSYLRKKVNISISIGNKQKNKTEEEDLQTKESNTDTVI